MQYNLQECIPFNNLSLPFQLCYSEKGYCNRHLTWCLNYTWKLQILRKYKENVTEKHRDKNTSMCKYIVSWVHVWKTQKNTSKTVYTSCYTERHSVWYIVYYCKHFLADNCYRVKRKHQENTLLLTWQPVSCKFFIVTLNCGAKGP